MTIIHVDSLLGSDSNPGTESLPKLTVKAAETAATVFDKVALRAGRCYSPVNGYFPRLQKNGLTLCAYGLPDGLSFTDSEIWDHYPILDGLTYENSNATGWTYEGDGVWSKTFASAKAKRVWFGAVNTGVLITQRVIGTAYRRTPDATADNLTAIKAALNNADRWHPAGSALGWKLYIYTGSATLSPPAYYDGLAILIADGATIGAQEGVYITQSVGAQAQNIHVRGAFGDSARIASLSSDTILTDEAIIQECLASYTGAANVFSIRTSGLNNTDPRKKISRSYIVDTKADSKTSQYEQEPSSAYSNLATMDMYVITGNAEDCHIQDFEAINSAHVGAAMGGQEFSEPVNCSIKYGHIKFDNWITYGRGLASSRMTSSVINACHVEGQNVRSQFADGHIVGNLWTNMRASIRKPTTDEWAAVECYAYDYGGADGPYRYEVRKPRDLRIEHNTVILPIASPGAYPLLLTTYGSAYPISDPNPSIDLNTVKVRNNIVVLDTPRSWLASFANGGAIADQLVQNNIIYTSGADATVRWAGATVGMNARTGHTGNLNVNPMLGADYRPLASSPAVGAGTPTGTTYADRLGVAFNPTTPTIGAFQYMLGTVVLNDRDAYLQLTPAGERDTNPGGGRALFFLDNNTRFQVTSGGAVTPSELRLSAKALNLPGAITWTTTPAVTLATDPAAPNDRILTAAAMGANTSVTVTITTQHQGQTYSAQRAITKVTDGVSNAVVYAYKRAAVAPTDNPGAVTYTFSSGSITTPATDTLANGWTKTIPAGDDPLYVIVASASNSTTTDAIAAGEWAAPVLWTKNGLNTATITIYQRSASTSAPALPTATTTYDFAAKTLTGLNNGWSTTLPAAGGDYLFASTATAASVTSTDTITAGEWAVARELARNGANGVGTNGKRGNAQIVASGSSWSDSTATTAIQSATGTNPIAHDQVTISNGSSFAQTRAWIGGDYPTGSWQTFAAWINGNMIVDETLSVSGDVISGGTITGVGINIGSGQFTVNASTGQVGAYNFFGYNSTFGNLSDPASPAVDAGNTGLTSSTTPVIRAISSTGGAGLEAGGGTYGKALSIVSGVSGIVQTGGGSNYLYNVLPSSDNAYSLGASGSLRWTAVYAMSSTITTSDERTKNVLGESDLGLDFICDLVPIRYTMKVAENIITDNWVTVREAYSFMDDYGTLVEVPAVVENQQVVTQKPGTRIHYGLSAQQLRATLLKHKQDNAAMWCLSNPADPDSQQAVRYEGLVAPLVQSTRQMRARIEQQDTTIALLVKRIEALEARLASQGS